MKVLLINPPFQRLMNRTGEKLPIGIMYLSSFLNSNGIETKIYNADCVKREMSFFSEIDDRMYERNLNDLNSTVWKNIKETIRMENPSVVGVSVWTSAYKSALNVARIAKGIDRNMKVVFGGIHPTTMPKETAMEKDVDFVVVGEGERTFLELIKNMGRPEKVDGICFKRGKEIILTKPREFIEDLDSLPFPDRDNIISDFGVPYKLDLGTVLTSRGCPYDCSFCASKVMWNRIVRYRSIERVVDEIESQVRKYGTNVFEILDDTFTIDPKRVEDFCQTLNERKLKIKWQCKARVDSLSEDLLRKMKSAGCESIAYGIESGNQQILNMMNKGVTVEQSRNAISSAKKAGIDTIAYFIVGYPEETAATMGDTESLIKELKCHMSSLSILTPYPGTKVYRDSKKDGLILTEDWSKYFHLGRKEIQMKLKHMKEDEFLERYMEIIRYVDRANAMNAFKKHMNPIKIMKDIAHDPGKTLDRIKIMFKLLGQAQHTSSE
jgi:radical SAM superfamily enzyme YgiQ (UPF0313 family)